VTSSLLVTIKGLGISPTVRHSTTTSNDKIFSMAVTATALPVTPFKAGSYYGSPSIHSTGMLSDVRAPNFSSAGSIDVFDPQANLVKNYTVGIGPNGCAFSSGYYCPHRSTGINRAVWQIFFKSLHQQSSHDQHNKNLSHKASTVPVAYINSETLV